MSNPSGLGQNNCRSRDLLIKKKHKRDKTGVLLTANYTIQNYVHLLW